MSLQNQNSFQFITAVISARHCIRALMFVTAGRQISPKHVQVTFHTKTQTISIRNYVLHKENLVYFYFFFFFMTIKHFKHICITVYKKINNLKKNDKHKLKAVQ